MHSLGEGVSCQGAALLILRIQKLPGKKSIRKYIGQKEGNFNQGVIGNIFNIPLWEYMNQQKSCLPLLLRKFVNI